MSPSQTPTKEHVPKLVIVGGDGNRREVDLTTGALRIGRAPENDLALPDPTKGVSRMHAELRYEHGRYVIVDLNSQNGTWLAGIRVQRADVASGAEIAIGPYRLTLVGVGASPVAIATQKAEGVATPAAPATPKSAAVESAARPAPVPAAAPAPAKSATVEPAAQPAAAAAAAPAPAKSATVESAAQPTAAAAAAPPTPKSAPVESAAQPAAAAAAPARPAVQRPPSRPGSVASAPAPGLMAGIARLPKTTLFGGFLAIVFVLAVLSQVFAPSKPAPASPVLGGAAADAKPAPASPVLGGAAADAKPAPANPVLGGAAADAKPTTDVQIIELHLAEGKALVEKKDFDRAIREHFDLILFLEPSHPEATDLRMKAQEALRQQKREAAAAAEAALEAGNKADAAGNWKQAIQQYQRAQKLDPSLAADAEDGTRRVREKMGVAGGDSFKRARQFDAVGRSAEAFKEYVNAAEWLPEGDPNRTVARQRAAQLKASLK